MKKNWKQGVSVLILSGVICFHAMSAMAATATISIPELGNGYTKKSATRSGKYSYVTAKCNSVYPTGNYSKDTFTRMQVKIFDSNSKAISDQKVLTEGQKSQSIKIWEGKLDKKSIKFGFCGNSTKSKAYAVVSYDAK